MSLRLGCDKIKNCICEAEIVHDLARAGVPCAHLDRLNCGACSTAHLLNKLDHWDNLC